MSGDNVVVPFGKYKDKPVEFMLSDQQYLEWLTAQPWFKERYTNIYNIVIGAGHEPHDTPEHNRIQMKFLDKEFIKKFSEFFNPEDEIDWLYSNHNRDFEYSEHRAPPIDVRLDVCLIRNVRTEQQCLDIRERTIKECKAIIERPVCGMAEQSQKTNAKYQLDYGRAPKTYDEKTLRFRIEIKPAVGDDYPSIFRQMKNSGSNILLTEKYIGQGATLEQVRAFFETAKMKVILLEEIEKSEKD